MGQHGEGGGGRQMLESADKTAEIMIGQLCEKIQPKPGDKVLLYINGVGSTTLMEQNIIFRRAHQVLARDGVEVVHAKIGELLTVQEMAGFQMILARLDADHIELLKNRKADAPYWTTV